MLIAIVRSVHEKGLALMMYYVLLVCFVCCLFDLFCFYCRVFFSTYVLCLFCMSHAKVSVDIIN